MNDQPHIPVTAPAPSVMADDATEEKAWREQIANDLTRVVTSLGDLLRAQETTNEALAGLIQTLQTRGGG